jgi:hypothetical protein
MLHHRTRFAGLLIILAAFVLVPSALAAAPAKRLGAATAKERLYAKHCGPKRTGSGRPAQRAKCLKAMARLATGKSSSPRAACRALSRKKLSGGRRSAFARCVSAGARLLKSKGRDNSDKATDGEGDDPDSGDGDGDDGDDSAGDPDDPDAAPDGSGPGDSSADAGRGAVDPDDEPEA